MQTETENVLEERVTASLADLMEWLTSTIRESEGFVVEQAPLVAQDIIRWGIWSSALVAILCLLGVVLVIVTAASLRATGRKEMAELDEKLKTSRVDWPQGWRDRVDVAAERNLIQAWNIAFAVAGAAVRMILIPIAMAHFSFMMKPIVAPRLYLLEWLRDLV